MSALCLLMIRRTPSVVTLGFAMVWALQCAGFEHPKSKQLHHCIYIQTSKSEYRHLIYIVHIHLTEHQPIFMDQLAILHCFDLFRRDHGEARLNTSIINVHAS